MTIPNSPQALPVAVPLAAKLTKDELEQDGVGDVATGPTVGASDADADAAASGADVDLHGAARDTDGVPVGAADAEEDRRASGA
jgi:hypothetical protein